MGQTSRIRAAGFSLIELVVVIVLLGILAVFVIPGLNLQGYREQGFFNQSQAALRYGQKYAVASGCHVAVTINDSSCTIQLNGAGSTGGPGGCPNTAINNPTGNGGEFCPQSAAASPNNLPQTVTFNNIGCPSNGDCPGSTETLNIGGRMLRIEAETGYIHEP